MRNHCDLNSCLWSFLVTILEGIEKRICESRKCKRIPTSSRMPPSWSKCSFSQCLPPPPPPAGTRVLKIKPFSSSLSEEYSPKRLCWTVSWGLSQTFGILQAGREKSPGTAFLEGPLPLPCCPDQQHLPPLGTARLWAGERVLALSFQELREEGLTLPLPLSGFHRRLS